MMQILMNPSYNTTAKTAEIMAKYRPIAPRPPEKIPLNLNNRPVSDEGSISSCSSSSSSMSEKIRQSPFLRNVWPSLQARPTRTRKRGRTSLAPPVSIFKRPRIFVQQSFSPPPDAAFVTAIPAENSSVQVSAHSAGAVAATITTTPPASLVTLPLLPCTSEFMCLLSHGGETGIDLNRAAEIPEETDFLQKLQRPTTTTNPRTGIIAPQPLRPILSVINVERIKPTCETTMVVEARKTPRQVEEEVESEVLPAVVSDSNNRVRLANSAYREMVGQPECSWLNSMINCDGGSRSSKKRICGEVMIQLSDSYDNRPFPSNGFSCMARIGWGSDGKKNAVDAFCATTRIACESKEYLFVWRFHIHAGEVSGTASN